MNNTAELLRLIHNLIRLGTIHKVDHERARCRVKIGDIITGWLPWQEARAGTTRDWDPPTENEQVLVLSPGGDPAAGIVVTGLYQDAHPAPAAADNLWRRIMPDGAVIEYDHEQHHLQATLPGSARIDATGAVNIHSGDDITITAAGNITMTANRIDLN